MSKKPFEPRSYTKLADSLLTLYLGLPDFRTNHIILYQYLCKLYNTELGYAFPTQEHMRAVLKINKKTQGSILKTLKKYELIDFRKHKFRSNYVYFINPPIEDPDEFYKKYPDVPRIKTEEESPEDILFWL